MTKSNGSRKLVLVRHTVVKLTASQLVRVAGAAEPAIVLHTSKAA